jgi:hypothetical protein
MGAAHLFRVILPVSDIDRAERFLRAAFEACATAGATFSPAAPPGVGPLGAIARRPWGEESFYASDPFGNPLCFVSSASVFTGS